MRVDRGTSGSKSTVWLKVSGENHLNPLVVESQEHSGLKPSENCHRPATSRSQEITMTPITVEQMGHLEWPHQFYFHFAKRNVYIIISIVCTKGVFPEFNDKKYYILKRLFETKMLPQHQQDTGSKEAL